MTHRGHRWVEPAFMSQEGGVSGAGTVSLVPLTVEINSVAASILAGANLTASPISIGNLLNSPALTAGANVTPPSQAVQLQIVTPVIIAGAIAIPLLTVQIQSVNLALVAGIELSLTALRVQVNPFAETTGGSNIIFTPLTLEARAINPTLSGGGNTTLVLPVITPVVNLSLKAGTEINLVPVVNYDTVPQFTASSGVIVNVDLTPGSLETQVGNLTISAGANLAATPTLVLTTIQVPTLLVGATVALVSLAVVQQIQIVSIPYGGTVSLFPLEIRSRLNPPNISGGAEVLLYPLDVPVWMVAFTLQMGSIPFELICMQIQINPEFSMEIITQPEVTMDVSIEECCDDC